MQAPGTAGAVATHLSAPLPVAVPHSAVLTYSSACLPANLFPAQVPVGRGTLGRIMNVIGEPVDECGPIGKHICCLMLAQRFTAGEAVEQQLFSDRRQLQTVALHRRHTWAGMGPPARVGCSLGSGGQWVCRYAVVAEEAAYGELQLCRPTALGHV